MRVLFLLLSCGQTPPPTSPAAERAAAPVPCDDDAIAFVDVDVVPIEPEGLLEHRTVVVCGDEIAALGPVREVGVPEGARVVDGSGKTLLPGLADMHVHLHHEDELLVYLANGITTVRNLWGAPMHVEWRGRVASGDLRGPRIVTAGPIVDGDPPIHDGSLVVTSPDQVDAAIRLHRAERYDFLKIYGLVSLPVFEALVRAARAEGLSIAGHVPRAAGIDRVADAFSTIEHINWIEEALQRDDSPVRGHWDRVSRQKKIDFVDESRLPALAKRLHDGGVFVCPTRVVADQDQAPDVVRALAGRPASRFVRPCERALWEPSEIDAETVERQARSLALYDRTLLGLSNAGVGLLTGTDVGNPLVVPGFSLHDEIRHFVRVGIPPQAALRAATLTPAELLGEEDEAGTVAVGRRADLVLVDGNPLDDVGAIDRIAGVVAQGRWLDADAIAAMLAEAETRIARWPFEGAPPLADGAVQHVSSFDLTWRDVPFGSEEIAVQTAGGATRVRARNDDPHRGETFTVDVETDPAGIPTRLTLSGEGAEGRGRLDVVRDGRRLTIRGRLLSGEAIESERPWPAGAVLSADGLLGSWAVLGPRLSALRVGREIRVPVVTIALGSKATLTDTTLRIVRIADADGERRFEVHGEGAPPTTLGLDADGWPASLVLEGHGATVRFRRRPASG